MSTRKSLLLAALLCASAFATGAHAQSIDLRVIGTITPPACVPTIAGGGVVNYGNISASTLNMTTHNRLPTQDVAFSIACNQAANVAVKVTDNRTASMIPGIASTIDPTVTDEHNHGLGTSGDVNVGGYVMRMVQGSFTGDGEPVYSVTSRDTGTTWGQHGGGHLTHGTGAYYSWSKTDGGAPDSFQNLAGTLQIEAVLNHGSALPLTGNVDLDGSATLELVYL